MDLHEYVIVRSGISTTFRKYGYLLCDQKDPLRYRRELFDNFID